MPDIYSVPRTYTEGKIKYVFRDVFMEDGTKKVQHLVREPWGEEFWNDNEPAENEVLGARPYDQSEHELERVKTRVPHEAAPEKPAEDHEKSNKKASPRKTKAKA